MQRESVDTAITFITTTKVYHPIWEKRQYIFISCRNIVMTQVSSNRNHLMTTPAQMLPQHRSVDSFWACNSMKRSTRNPLLHLFCEQFPHFARFNPPHFTNWFDILVVLHTSFRHVHLVKATLHCMMIINDNSETSIKSLLLLMQGAFT